MSIIVRVIMGPSASFVLVLRADNMGGIELTSCPESDFAAEHDVNLPRGSHLWH